MSARPALRRAVVAPSLIGLAIAAASVSPATSGSAPAAASASASGRSSDDLRLVAAHPAPAPVVLHRAAIHPILMGLPVARYRLTGRFGDVSGLWRTVHSGLDFAAPEGTPIHAVAAGTVVSAAYDGSYGNKTVVRLPDGTELWYCHQSAFEVHPGQRVVTGQTVGLVGATGNVTGPHVHLEVHPHGGDAVDPYRWLVAKGLRP